MPDVQYLHGWMHFQTPASGISHRTSLLSLTLAPRVRTLTTRAKDVLPNIHHMQALKITPHSDRMVPSAAAAHCLQRAHTIRMLPGLTERIFCPWWPWPLTFTFKLVCVRDQTHLPCKCHVNPFSSSRDIWGTNKKRKKSQTVLKTEPYLHAVTTY